MSPPIRRKKSGNLQIILLKTDTYKITQKQSDTAIYVIIYTMNLPNHGQVENKKKLIVIIFIFLFCIGVIGWIQNKTKFIGKNTKTVPTAIPTEKPSDISKKYTDMNYKVRRSNMERQSDINSVANAVLMYRAYHGSDIPEITAEKRYISKSEADICKYIVPEYLNSLPIDSYVKPDPNQYEMGGSVSDCNSAYETGYTIEKNIQGRIILTAPHTEEIPVITVTR